ncbi:NUDIX domain-containing protein [Arthrobacter echini]|uniref:NUDIX domain-containing protein n=1 Tax=Arthrobacter echini TaxID=1529066 RepID=A0A5D0XLY7_9MICC|nr:NUDIX domain-containing protein [Arthrobacter echini]
MQKVVGYVVHDDQLLVFTHDDVALAIAGVQVPAGTLEAGESPAEAVVREVLEETGRRTFVVRDLGVERYDAWPAKDEVHERRFFQLELIDELTLDRWSAGEDHPSDGGAPQRWICQANPQTLPHPPLRAGSFCGLGGGCGHRADRRRQLRLLPRLSATGMIVVQAAPTPL